MPDTARAIVFTGAGRRLEIHDFPLPELALGEVLIRTTCTTICGSDLSSYTGRRSTPTPTVLGHEVLGVIEAFGPGPAPSDWHGKPLAVGERVTWSVAASCGECFYCDRRLPQKCERLFKYGHEPLGEHPLSGGLAEYCHLAAGTAILSIPEGVPDVVACPANCAIATAAATLRCGELDKAEVIWIQGAGTLGLSACALARSMGASTIVVSDVDEQRLALARRFGADICVNVGPDASGITEAVAAKTAGHGFDLVLELSGAEGTIELGLEHLRIGGRYVFAGSVSPTKDLAINPEHVVRRLLTIRGVHNYTPDDLGTAIAFLAREHDRFPFAELVAKSFKLADAEAAFQYALENHALRVAVLP